MKKALQQTNIIPKSLILALCMAISIPLSLVLMTNALAQDEDAKMTMSIKDYLESALPPLEGRAIDYNELTGILTITDTPSNHRLIRNLVKQFDIGPRQVLIEAKFVEITFTDLNEFGIEWYWFREPGSDEDLFSDIGVGSKTPAGSTPTSDGPYGVHWDTSTTNFPLTDYGADFFLSYTRASGSFLRAYLHALASEGKANLLAAPRVTTLTGQMANIQVTRSIPYVTDVELENEGTADHPIWVIKRTFEEKEIGISLEVTPYVSEATNVITLELHPEISTLYAQYPIGIWSTATEDWSLVPADMGYPSIDIRTAQTTVKVKSGDTIIMGGFVQDEDTVHEKKIPFLGDIPVIGELFKYKYQDRTKKNLAIFLTATLLTSEGRKIR